jgi:hypothetical protein
MARFLLSTSFAGFLFAASATATPITVGGFTFPRGEAAFADDAIVTSGVVTGSNAAAVRQTLVGSHVGDSIRVITPDIAVIEIHFTDNAVENGSGTDLVLFELSGSGFPVGQGDPTEKFEFSVFDGSTFTPFIEVVPVNTGVVAPHDSTLSVYAVQIDLQDYGFAPGQTTQRIQIRLVDNLAGTRSADPTAFGALNSVPVSEPFLTLLFAWGALALKRRLAFV